ncbi:hypothetical protein HDU96_010220 [Phlyctochytrium bullatum]|nr:hypothetical protein HDU96_010220 [Phlyctochytrium bullatum]
MPPSTSSSPSKVKLRKDDALDKSRKTSPLLRLPEEVLVDHIALRCDTLQDRMALCHTNSRLHTILLPAVVRCLNGNETSMDLFLKAFVSNTIINAVKTFVLTDTEFGTATPPSAIETLHAISASLSKLRITLSSEEISDLISSCVRLEHLSVHLALVSNSNFLKSPAFLTTLTSLSRLELKITHYGDNNMLQEFLDHLGSSLSSKRLAGLLLDVKAVNSNAGVADSAASSSHVPRLLMQVACAQHQLRELHVSPIVCPSISHPDASFVEESLGELKSLTRLTWAHMPVLESLPSLEYVDLTVGPTSYADPNVLLRLRRAFDSCHIWGRNLKTFKLKVMSPLLDLQVFPEDNPTLPVEYAGVLKLVGKAPAPIEPTGSGSGIAPSQQSPKFSGALACPNMKELDIVFNGGQVLDLPAAFDRATPNSTLISLKLVAFMNEACLLALARFVSTCSALRSVTLGTDEKNVLVPLFYLMKDVDFSIENRTTIVRNLFSAPQLRSASFNEPFSLDLRILLSHVKRKGCPNLINLDIRLGKDTPFNDTMKTVADILVWHPALKNLKLIANYCYDSVGGFSSLRCPYFSTFVARVLDLNPYKPWSLIVDLKVEHVNSSQELSVILALIPLVTDCLSLRSLTVLNVPHSQIQNAIHLLTSLEECRSTEMREVEVRFSLDQRPVDPKVSHIVWPWRRYFLVDGKPLGPLVRDGYYEFGRRLLSHQQQFISGTDDDTDMDSEESEDDVNDDHGHALPPMWDPGDHVPLGDGGVWNGYADAGYDEDYDDEDASFRDPAASIDDSQYNAFEDADDYFPEPAADPLALECPEGYAELEPAQALDSFSPYSNESPDGAIFPAGGGAIGQDDDEELDADSQASDGMHALDAAGLAAEGFEGEYEEDEGGIPVNDAELVDDSDSEEVSPAEPIQYGASGDSFVYPVPSGGFAKNEGEEDDAAALGMYGPLDDGALGGLGDHYGASYSGYVSVLPEQQGIDDDDEDEEEDGQAELHGGAWSESSAAFQQAGPFLVSDSEESKTTGDDGNAYPEESPTAVEGAWAGLESVATGGMDPVTIEDAESDSSEEDEPFAASDYAHPDATYVESGYLETSGLTQDFAGASLAQASSNDEAEIAGADSDDSEDFVGQDGVAVDADASVYYDEEEVGYADSGQYEDAGMLDEGGFGYDGGDDSAYDGYGGYAEEAESVGYEDEGGYGDGYDEGDGYYAGYSDHYIDDSD